MSPTGLTWAAYSAHVPDPSYPARLRLTHLLVATYFSRYKTALSSGSRMYDTYPNYTLASIPMNESNGPYMGSLLCPCA
eukprot:jgi/Botrbrau1/4027/Bobra.0016s0034.1